MCFILTCFGASVIAILMRFEKSGDRLFARVKKSNRSDFWFNTSLLQETEFQPFLSDLFLGEMWQC